MKIELAEKVATKPKGIDYKNTAMQDIKSGRIQSLDFLKGLVILLMALDHVRDYFHYDSFFIDPTNIEETNFWFFFTRFITHFCAPVFVFLAGTSAYFVQKKIGKPSISAWLLKRGLWLIFAEVIIISFGWRFQMNFNPILFQVIWLLGASMIFLAVFVHLPKKVMIALCLIVIFGHNLLDSYNFDQLGGLWNVLHLRGVIEFSDTISVLIAYPLIPWVFVMPLGYYLGKLYEPNADPKNRKDQLIIIGITAIILFFILRWMNIYGNLSPWVTYLDDTKTFMSFFNVSKYPPSLLYLLITLGPALIVLSLAEGLKGKLFNIVVLFGKVPMFFYIIHIYFIHILAVFAVYLSGYDPQLMVFDVWISFVPELKGYGYSLGIVYIIWLGVIASLYPLCACYWNYKKAHRQYWFLSYL